MHPLFIFSHQVILMRRYNQKEEYYSTINFEFNDFSEPEKLVLELVDKISILSNSVEFNSFGIGFSWPKISEEELDKLKKSVQYSLIVKIEAKFEKKVDFGAHDAYFLVDFNKKEVFLRLMQVFVKGNYCKFSRSIAQTTHFCRFCRGGGCEKCTGGLKTIASVEQLLAEIFLPEFGAKQLKFHGAGREDVDVLMLGNGRPFVVELIQPQKRIRDLKKIGKKINEKFKEKISVNSLELVEKGKVAEVKNSVHEKIYLAKVLCESEPNLELLKVDKLINVEQRTPVRVEKRRTDMVRKKEVTILEVKKINEKEFGLKIKTSHGTYVKEFISGDDGRSIPSISSMLGIKCECTQLDVLKIV